MRDIYPVKYYKDEGFVEYKLEIDDDDLYEIIQEYLWSHVDFDFEELEIVNNRPMNIWLYAKCRKYVDFDDELAHEYKDKESIEKALADAEVEVSGEYDGNPTGM